MSEEIVLGQYECAKREGRGIVVTNKRPGQTYKEYLEEIIAAAQANQNVCSEITSGVCSDNCQIRSLKMRAQEKLLELVRQN